MPRFAKKWKSELIDRKSRQQNLWNYKKPSWHIIWRVIQNPNGGNMISARTMATNWSSCEHLGLLWYFKHPFCSTLLTVSWKTLNLLDNFRYDDPTRILTLLQILLARLVISNLGNPLFWKLRHHIPCSHCAIVSVNDCLRIILSAWNVYNFTFCICPTRLLELFRISSLHDITV